MLEPFLLLVRLYICMAFQSRIFTNEYGNLVFKRRSISSIWQLWTLLGVLCMYICMYGNIWKTKVSNEDPSEVALGVFKPCLFSLSWCLWILPALRCLDFNSQNAPASVLTGEFWELKSTHFKVGKIGNTALVLRVLCGHAIENWQCNTISHFFLKKKK